MAIETQNPNLTAASSAADAVDPGSVQNARFIAQMNARSPADLMREQQAQRGQPAARAVPDLDQNNDFMKGLDQAIGQKTNQDSGDVSPEPETGQDGKGGEPALPPAERKLTDPPKIPNRQHVKALKQSFAQDRQSWEQERATLLKQLEDLKGSSAPQPKPESTPQLTEILTENKTLKEELALLDITRSPDFNAKFENPKRVTIQQAKNIAGPKAADVEAILSMPPGSLRDGKLEELLGELPPSTAAIVKAANNKLAEIDFSRQVEIETARASMTERQKAREQQLMMVQAQRSREFDALLKEWQSEVDALDVGKNKEANVLISQARQLFNGEGLSDRERAAAALQSALLPAVLREHEQALAEVQKLKSALARYEGGLPSEDGGAAIESNDTRVPASPAERIRGFEQGLDQAMRRDPTWAQQRKGRIY